MTQLDPWILERLAALFGGSVRPRHGRRERCFHWSLSGSRKREFAELIYDFLSPRRQAQVDAARQGAKW